MKRFILSALVALAAAPMWGLSLPGEWDFGEAGDGRKITASISISNDGKSAVSVSLISPCDCLVLTPSSLTLKPGERRTVSVVFDPAGYWGKIDKPVLVRIKGGADRLFSVRGFIKPAAPVPDYPGECEWCRKQSEENRRAAYESWRSGPGVIRYYFSTGCRTCTEFISAEVPRVSALLGRTIEVDALDISVPGYLAELDALLARGGTGLRAFPVLVVGKTILQGEMEIRERFENEARKIPG